MLLLSVNTIFAFIFLAFARTAFLQSVPFLRVGWEAIDTETSKPNYRQNIESRRRVAEGGRYLIGGLLWMGACAGSAAIGLFFVWQAISLYV